MDSDFLAFVGKEKPGILIAAETHVTKPEAREWVAPRYVLLTERSQPKDDQRMPCGVATLAKRAESLVNSTFGSPTVYIVRIGTLRPLKSLGFSFHQRVDGQRIRWACSHEGNRG